MQRGMIKIGWLPHADTTCTITNCITMRFNSFYAPITMLHAHL
ncbi:hypothetical protein HMPREF1991_01487 [Hoylesella loescheii DSM 19665 = JCM 12249 = ATCC 15930]|uniref:Uncharacterized protein n=1 Tax=Hoylesella loescheii DSM 19665 = JCM 12249 = ATCC 15930 TaxID=1122985 RepID=A0A069QHY1_HOYLO|nr:hypothetical protein HMPREF1991_01487 [Hoylesella loescheii DSM 19665 = JCM 12249 = ATCC 15930]